MKYFLLISFSALLFMTAPSQAQEEIDDMAPESYQNPVIDQGAGLLFSDLNGALPKGLWWKQNRSDIIYLLQNLPAEAPSRAFQEIKRNMLVSYYDTSVITDDIIEEDGTGLLSVRLQKLMEMGFWDDAFKLYTDNIDDPGDISTLAEIGVMIIMNMQGVSTACLEEKVLYPRFADLPFWQRLDQLCSIELGMIPTSDANFDSETLQSVYLKPDFKISANDIDKLKTLNGLELAILSHKGKIDYNGFAPSAAIPPHITQLFLKDKNLSEAQKDKLRPIAMAQALKPLPAIDEKTQNLTKEASTAEQKDVLHAVAQLLRRGEEITETITNRLNELAATHPENYYILKIISHVDENYGNIIIDKDNFNLGLETLRKNYPNMVIFLQNALDKAPLFSNNPVAVYEKQLIRQSDSDDDTPQVSENKQMEEWLEAALTHRMTGLALVLVLSNTENFVSSDETINPIKSLSTVGLINQAHHLTREKLAELIEALI